MVKAFFGKNGRPVEEIVSGTLKKFYKFE